jgi:hypothetical protein
MEDVIRIWGHKFFAATGKQYTKKQLKNHWDNLKILYNFRKSLWTNTGLGKNTDLGLLWQVTNGGRITQKV